MADETKYSRETQLIYGKDYSNRWDFSKHVIPPISTSTNFRFASVDDGKRAFTQLGDRASGKMLDEYHFIYDRMDEPNKNLLEEQLTIAEEGDVSLVFATGMAAISTTICAIVSAGEEIITGMPIYGCTYDLLAKHFRARLGFTVSHMDFRDTEVLAKAITSKTRLVYFESPANPSMAIYDIKAVADVVKKANEGRKRKIILAIDNTFASPFCQRPLTMGADLVLHSLTKFIGGFGTVMGGAVVARKENLGIIGDIIQLRKDFGGALSPFNAWNIMVYGLATLPMRMRAIQANAIKVAQFLDSEMREKVESVVYPGIMKGREQEIVRRQMVDYNGQFAPGGMISFILKGSNAQAQVEAGTALMNYLAKNAYAITLAVSLGQIRTLVEHPAGMTHSAIPEEVGLVQGVHPGGVRLAIGIEPIEDLLKDLREAFQAVKIK